MTRQRNPYADKPPEAAERPKQKQYRRWRKDTQPPDPPTIQGSGLWALLWALWRLPGGKGLLITLGILGGLLLAGLVVVILVPALLVGAGILLAAALVGVLVAAAMRAIRG